MALIEIALLKTSSLVLKMSLLLDVDLVMTVFVSVKLSKPLFACPAEFFLVSVELDLQNRAGNPFNARAGSFSRRR